MSELISMLIRFLRAFQVLVVICPWEQAIRVRGGKRVKLLNGGIHLKLPFLDAVFVQTVRRRVNQIGKQTISTRDGKTISLASSMGYAINNVELLYNTLHHAEDTLANLVRSAIADYVAHHDLDECLPGSIENELELELDFSEYGIGQVTVSIVEFAVVRTYRLIGDYGFYQCGSALKTDATTFPGAPA